jgi:hypothetical protein
MSLDGYHVDYTDQLADMTGGQGGIFPEGLQELARQYDILGNCTVTNRLNFAIFYVFTKAPGDDIGAKINAEALAALQTWAQAQSVMRLAPTFGNTGEREQITVSNGILEEAADEGIARYSVILSITYKYWYQK